LSSEERKIEIDEEIEQQTEEVAEENSQDSSDECQEEIKKLKEQISLLEDKYVRTNADFDNIKKRMEKEKSQAVSYAHEVFARDLLPIIDALEMV